MIYGGRAANIPLHGRDETHFHGGTAHPRLPAALRDASSPGSLCAIAGITHAEAASVQFWAVNYPTWLRLKAGDEAARSLSFETERMYRSIVWRLQRVQPFGRMRGS